MQTPNLKDVLERSERPKFIHGLRMEEISGVDHPAHEQEGWLVMKARKMGSIGSWHGLVGDYAIVAKSVNKERRYTLGLLYAASNPGEAVADAHGDSISEAELYNARLNYVKAGDRSIHLQHGDHGIVKLGEWIDIMQWPDPVEAEFKLPGNKIVTKVTIPANSVWVGIEWNDTGWPMVKAGDLRGLSLGGFRRKTQKAKETDMAEIVKDSLEGYAYEGIRKVAPKPVIDVPPTPKPTPTAFPKFPQVAETDHKPRLDRRFEEYLRGLADGMEPDRYRRMLEIIAEFNDRALQVTDQAGHVANLKQLAADLRKIMFNDHDVVQILRMGRFVLPEEAMDNWPETPKVPHGLGKTLMSKLRRGMNQNALSSFTGEEEDPVGLLAEKRKHPKDHKKDKD